MGSRYILSMMLLALAVLACDFSAATDVVGGDTASDTGVLPDDDSAGQGANDTADDVELDPEDQDDDGDGTSENDGDCDDSDDAVHPGADDTCNGLDDDCDGEIDEDAASEDSYEPNDASGYYLGSLGDDPDHTLQATLHNDDDVDRFTFSFEDSGWGLFTLDVGLSDIPAGATFRMAVENTTTGERYFSDYGSGSLSTSISDTVFDNEGGMWEVTIDALGGADCSARYLLAISLSG